MILRAILILVMLAGLIGSAGIAWVVAHPTAPAAKDHQAEPEPTRAVLVAARALVSGALLKPEDLTVQKLASKSAPDDAFGDDDDNRRTLVGAMLRRSLAAGAPLAPRDVLRPGEHGFLAAVLSPGMRAVTVGVDAVSGAAGLIWPGDRVDLILTQALEQPNLSAGRRVAAETVLQDVRVIAIDHRLAPEAAPEGQIARTVTLEVNEAAAERISVATRLGRLSLAVRAADHALAEPLPMTSPPHTTWAGDVSEALAGDAGRRRPAIIRVFQGRDDGKEFHFE